MVKEALKKSGSVPGKFNGFSIIEILIVLAVIGLVIAAFGPQLVRSPRASRQAFLTEFQGVVRTAQYEALMQQKMHRVIFNMEKAFARVERVVYVAGLPEPKFEPVQGLLTEMAWPMRYEIRSFKVGGIEQAGGGELKETWFFVDATGMIQEVQLGIIDTEDNDRAIRIQIQPFTAECKVEYAAA